MASADLYNPTGLHKPLTHDEVAVYFACQQQQQQVV
jgi:hypothetical protein